jgi:hypothetical protein
MVVEKLESNRGDKTRPAYENRYYNQWPVGKIKEFVTERLKPLIVAVNEVDERNTSQVCENQWGYRDGNDFYYIKDGELKKVHADENAANNILDRARSKNTNLYSIYLVNPVGDYFVSSALWNPKEDTGKYVRGFLTKLYKTSDVVFVKKDGKLVRSDLTVSELKKLAGKMETKRGDYWYRINNTEWIDEAARAAIIDNVEREVKRERESAKASLPSLSQLITTSQIDFSGNLEKGSVLIGAKTE